jgi:BirA family biotin operon repressor/biotin-[acetyl-CoA-carboxylase] ligase
LTPPLSQRLHGLLAASSGGTGSAAPLAFRSGEHLAAALGVSRSAIWKAAAQLRGLGVEIQALPRQGYRLARPADPLSADGVRGLLAPQTAQQLRDGRCLWMTGSTNADLLARGGLSAGQFDFLTAETQSEGRGRRGRRWLAPPGGAICLSWSWSFDALPAQSGALSLAVGVTALRALQRCGVAGVQLKWPNDLVTAAGKLGGILIELRSESGGPTHVVIGMGLNVALGRAVADAVAASGNRATDLAALGAAGIGRNRLVAALLDAGVAGMQQFTRDGFGSFIAEYREADALRGAAVTLHGVQDTRDGIAVGIDADGALLLQEAQGVKRVLSGEISVRRRTTQGLA